MATAPVNVLVNLQQTCYSKCNYSFKYPITNLVIENNGTYLSFKLDDTQDSPVVYNNVTYNVFEIRIYQPSLHKYVNIDASGEMVIHHTSSLGGNLNLMVCIPITPSSTSTTDATTFLDLIMNEVKRTAPNVNNKTTFSNPTFSINPFIPMKPYVSYNGTNVWSPTRTNYDYIVFLKENAINISVSAMNVLRDVIKIHPTISIPTNNINNTPKIFYNANGPEKQSSGEIYIDCQPTGDDGEILVAKKPESGQLIDKYAVRDAMNHTMVKIIIGAIVMIVIWFLAIKIINGIARGATKVTAAAIAKVQN